MNKKELVLNKKNRITYHNGFVIEGIVIDADDDGVILQTDQKTSFISWQAIKTILPLE